MGIMARLFRKKENKFDHIISLGYNCEVSYRFVKYFKFEESNLFNWTYIHSIQELIYALKNYDSIGSGEFDLPNPLWECQNTRIRFHGKIDMGLYVNQTATDKIIEEDRIDLISRIKHFKEKFLNILRDNSSKLFIYKIHNGELKESYIESLLQALTDLGGKNFKLMFVCSESKKNTIHSTFNDKFIVRYVAEFPPDDKVTDEKYYNNGWDDIFDEFYCKKPKKYKKNKKYKFEKQKEKL